MQGRLIHSPLSFHPSLHPSLALLHISPSFIPYYLHHYSFFLIVLLYSPSLSLSPPLFPSLHSFLVCSPFLVFSNTQTDAAANHISTIVSPTFSEFRHHLSGLQGVPAIHSLANSLLFHSFFPAALDQSKFT